MNHKNPKSLKVLREAVENVGTQKEFAMLLAKHTKKRCSQQLVSLWLQNGIPVKWVLPVEKLTGVPRHELAPDIYPND